MYGTEGFEVRKTELYLLAVDDEIPLDERYEAARELQKLNLARVNEKKVRELLKFYTVSEIAEMMNVSFYTIIGVIARIERKGKATVIKRWTPEEDEFLRKNSPQMTIEEIAEKLGRSVGAVRSRAKRLKVRTKQRTPVINRCRSIYDPFVADASFISGYQIAHKHHPECGCCNKQVELYDTVRWVGKEEQKKLMCMKCAG